MSHTPEQALSLWCPMVRHEGNVGGSFSRGTLNSNPTNADTPVDEVTAPVPEQIYGCHCIADKCAMWRWDTQMHLSNQAQPFRGYCGLAGKPC